MKSFRKCIIAAIALLKSLKRHIIIAVIVLILGLAYIMDSYCTQLKEVNALTLQPSNTSDNFTTDSDTANVAIADPLTVVRATPELLASIVAKAGNQALPGGVNSSQLNTAAIAPRAPAAETPLTPTPIPPSTALLGSGLVALLALRKRNRKTLV